MAAPSHLQIARHLAYTHDLETLGRAFLENKIAPLLVKGQALVDVAYPEDTLRPAVDIDLLVHDDEAHVCTVLQRLGYREKAQRHRRFSQFYLGERQFFASAAAQQTLVEVHRFLDKLFLRPIDYKGIQARAVVGKQPGFRYPSVEDHLLLVVLHAVSSNPLDRERTLDDINGLVRRGSPHWPWVIERARDWYLTHALGVWLTWAVQHRQTPVPREVLTAPRRRLETWSRQLPRRWRVVGDACLWHDRPAKVVYGALRYGFARLLDRVELLF